jgi:hypothetical protein
MKIRQTILGRMQNNMLQWYGHVMLGDNIWPKHILTWALEEKRRQRPEMKWEREVKIVTKQKNVTPEDAANWQI